MATLVTFGSHLDVGLDQSDNIGRRVYHSSVRRLYRPLGLLLAIVLFQLVLVESGYACQLPATGAMSDAGMAGMPMPAEQSHAPSAPTQQDPHDQQHSPCQFPWAPNGCQTMAPCSPAAMTVPLATTVSPAPARIALLPLELLQPASPSRAPELPPPRA
jgi:hypothetical protein